MGRAPCCEKVGLKRGRWTSEEDQLLLNYIKNNGEGSWRSLPKNAGLLRCGKSCRLRWINYLREDLKRGNITEEEEKTILSLRASLGNRWSLIASHLPGRTDNEIKNYWNAHLSKKVRQSSSPCSSAVTDDDADASTTSPGKRKRGQTTTKRKKKKTKSSYGEKTTKSATSGTSMEDSTMQVVHTTNTTNKETFMSLESGDGELDSFQCLGEIENSLDGVDPMAQEELLGEKAPTNGKGATMDGEGMVESSKPHEEECLSLEELENIPWEDDVDLWRCLWDGGDFEFDGGPPELHGEALSDLDDLENWLFSGIP